jgi:ubiquinone/menaquinone biosynthesis C-methylase UbiE
MSDSSVSRACPVCYADSISFFGEFDGYYLDQCNVCGHRFTRNRPSEAELSDYYSNAAVAFAPKERLNRRLKYWLFSKYVQRICKVPKIKALEIGCFQGDFLTAVKDNPRFDAEGIDLEEGAIKYAKAKGCNVSQSTLADKNYADGSFDFVLAIHVLEHLRDVEETIKEIRRVIKPGGHFFAVCPCVSHIKSRIGGKSWKYIFLPDHLTYFSTKSFRILLERLGFEVKYSSCLYHRAHVRILAKAV